MEKRGVFVLVVLALILTIFPNQVSATHSVCIKFDPNIGCTQESQPPHDSPENLVLPELPSDAPASAKAAFELAKNAQALSALMQDYYAGKIGKDALEKAMNLQIDGIKKIRDALKTEFDQFIAEEDQRIANLQPCYDSQRVDQCAQYNARQRAEWPPEKQKLTEEFNKVLKSFDDAAVQMQSQLSQIIGAAPTQGAPEAKSDTGELKPFDVNTAKREGETDAQYEERMEKLREYKKSLDSEAKDLKDICGANWAAGGPKCEYPSFYSDKQIELLNKRIEKLNRGYEDISKGITKGESIWNDFKSGKIRDGFGKGFELIKSFFKQDGPAPATSPPDTKTPPTGTPSAGTPTTPGTQSPTTPTTPGTTTPGKTSPSPAPGTQPGSSTGGTTPGQAITAPTISQITTSEPGVTTITDGSGGFIISGEEGQPIEGTGGIHQGEADKLPTDYKLKEEKSSSPPDNPSTPENETEIFEKEEAANLCKEGICIVSPAQNSIFSLAVAKNVNSQIQILSGNESRCTYGVNQDLSFQSGEKFIEDQAGVNTQHTIFMYYLGEIKTGRYNIYHKCQDTGGNIISKVQTFVVSDSGVDCRIKEGDQTGMTAEVVKDPTTGVESCKVIPLAAPTENITGGAKNVTLVVEKNGESVREVPLTADVVAHTPEESGETKKSSPAPGISNPVKIVASSVILALIAAGAFFITSQSRKLKSIVPADAAAPLISYPTVAEQQQMAQSMPNQVSAASDTINQTSQGNSSTL